MPVDTGMKIFNCPLRNSDSDAKKIEYINRELK